ncbi:MAG: cyclic nucleotide-binding domain-containing protein [Elusimicrobia bacterium]|nr:cyclic nucleotide-binding domain-containing protein [Elusimicrobiota bacterium]
MTERKAVHADLKTLSSTFSILTSELEKTLNSLTVCVYEPGAVILKEGETGTEVYVALKGRLSVRQSRWLVLSKEVAQLGPGDIFGEIGFLVPTNRSASVVAVEPCEAARIGLGDFKALLDVHSELRAGIEEMARRRLYSLSASTQS